jgi:hypothetical protein
VFLTKAAAAALAVELLPSIGLRFDGNPRRRRDYREENWQWRRSGEDEVAEGEGFLRT